MRRRGAQASAAATDAPGTLPAGLHEGGDDGLHLVGRDRETDAVGGNAGGGVKRRERGDADELALQVDERAAAVARIDGGAGLDHPGQRVGLAVYLLLALAVERAHDARSCRLLQAQWAADRQRE